MLVYQRVTTLNPGGDLGVPAFLHRLTAAADLETSDVCSGGWETKGGAKGRWLWPQMVVSIAMGVQQNGFFMRQNPTKMDDFWGTLFWETSKSQGFKRAITCKLAKTLEFIVVQVTCEMNLERRVDLCLVKQHLNGFGHQWSWGKTGVPAFPHVYWVIKRHFLMIE